MSENRYIIKHSGILGMKWFHRRFQNPDGTYTEEGKARRRKDNPKMTKEQKKAMLNRAFKANIKNGKDRPNISPVGQIGKSSQDILNTTSRIVNRYDTPKKQDLSKYSDEDLRKIINRKELENRYNNLSQSEIKSGMQVASEILDTVGDVAAIGVSAALIYETFRKIKFGD